MPMWEAGEDFGATGRRIDCGGDDRGFRTYQGQGAHPLECEHEANERELKN